MREKTVKKDVAKKDTWKSLNFSELTQKLVELKFKCLHCRKFSREDIDIDTSDIREKFKGITYEKRNGAIRTK